MSNEFYSAYTAILILMILKANAHLGFCLLPKRPLIYVLLGVRLIIGSGETGEEAP